MKIIHGPGKDSGKIEEKLQDTLRKFATSGKEAVMVCDLFKQREMEIDTINESWYEWLKTVTLSNGFG